MPPKNLKRLAKGKKAVVVLKVPEPPKVPKVVPKRGGRRGDGLQSPPPGAPLVPPPKSPPVDLTTSQQLMEQFQAFMRATQDKAPGKSDALIPLGVAPLPPPLVDQSTVSSGSKKKKSSKSKKGPKGDPKKGKAGAKKVVEIPSSSGSESSGTEGGDESESSESESVSSVGKSSSSSDSSRGSRSKKRRHHRIKLFKSRKMKAPDANALATAMLDWDAGVTLVGHSAMLLFQGVVAQLEKVTPSPHAKKHKLSTLERLQLHTGSETPSSSLPEKFAGYVMEMVPVKLLRRLLRNSRAILSLDHYWEKNKGNFVAHDAVCKADAVDNKRRLATFTGSGFDLIELHSTIAMVMSIVDPVHGLALQALTRVLAKLLAAGYSAPVAIRYASTIHAELALDAARKSTYGKCFSIDLPTLANCNTEPSASTLGLPSPAPRTAAAPPRLEAAGTPDKSRGACYAYNSRDGCSKGPECHFSHHCGLCKSTNHGKGHCPSASRDHRSHERERR